MSLHNEISQLAQAVRRVESGQRVQGIMVQFSSERLGARAAHQAHIGGFIVLGVLAGGFAQCGGGCLGVEYVVHYLKREADAFGVTVETGQCRVVECIAALSAEQYRSANQRARFVDMHEFQLGQGQRPPHAGQINRLAARHPA